MKLTKKEKEFTYKCFERGIALAKAANAAKSVGLEKTVAKIL